MCIRDSYNEYVGRIAIGRIERGIIRHNQEIAVCTYGDEEFVKKAKAVNLYEMCIRDSYYGGKACSRAFLDTC